MFIRFLSIDYSSTQSCPILRYHEARHEDFLENVHVTTLTEDAIYVLQDGDVAHSLMSDALYYSTCRQREPAWVE